MKTISVCLLITAIMVQAVNGDCGCEAWCREQGYPDGICGDDQACICSPKTVRKRGEYVGGQYRLTIKNEAQQGISKETVQRIVKTYFQVYPPMRTRFNSGATRHVQITLDPNYNGVAYASGGQIVISARYLASHPKDTDLVTHELMHVVQQYPGGQPGWLVEGIADYARWNYGVDNAGANWQLPPFQPSQRYTDAYRVTARFLVWLERRVKRDIVDQLDKALRENRYNNGRIWNQLTGKSVDQLWNDYSRSPNLQKRLIY